RSISSFNPKQTRRVYNTLVMLAALMDMVSPGHLWKGRLQRIIERHHIQTRAMGFPDDWQQRPIWAEVQENGRRVSLSTRRRRILGWSGRGRMQRIGKKSRYLV